MSQDPFQDAYQDPLRNPYQTPAQGGNAYGEQPPGNPLMAPAIILLVMSSMMLLYGLVNLVYGFMTGPPPVDPNVPNADALAQGQKIGFYGSVILIPIVNSVVVLGSIAMLRLKSRGLALTGAILALVPVCGPCFILGIPIGIWCLVLLNRQDVVQRFS